MDRLKRLCQWILRRRYPLVLVGVGLLLVSPSLWVGVQLDDITIRTKVLGGLPLEGAGSSPWEPFTFLDGDPDRTRLLMDSGLVPWWTDPQCRLSFMRPLTALTHMLDYRVWPDYPLLMHVQSLAWFALLIWAAAVFYRRVMRGAVPAWVAGLAALLFTLDDAHALPAGWLANRNELLAALFGILALILHDRWRRDGWWPGILLGPLALLTGLLAKESAVSTGGYLLGYAIFLDRGRWGGRLASLWPYLVVGTAWYTVYKLLGFGVAASGVYVDPAHDPIGFARHVASYGPILLLGQWGFPMSDVSMFLSVSAYKLHWAWAVVYLTLVGVLLWPLIARNAVARFWTLGMVLAILPACAAFPMDRLLMFAGLGAMGLLAQWIGGLKEGESWVPHTVNWKRPAGVLGFLLLAIHLVIAPLMLLVLVNTPRLMGHEAGLLWDTFPADPQLRSQTVVVVNPVSLAEVLMRAQLRHYEGQPYPARTLMLAPSLCSASLKRTDSRTLVVRPRGGFLPPPGRSPGGRQRSPAVSIVHVVRMLEQLIRDRRNPLKLGQTIDLSAVTIEITALTADGRPAEATFRFRVPLEDPSLRWLQATSEGYVPFRLPAIGETVEVPMLRLAELTRE